MHSFSSLLSLPHEIIYGSSVSSVYTKYTCRYEISDWCTMDGNEFIALNSIHLLHLMDCINIHVFGPVEGRRHDETLYRKSGLEALLAHHFYDPDGKPLYIYGDPAYRLGPHLLSPCPSITDNQKH